MTIIHPSDEGTARKPAFRDTFSGLEQTIPPLCDPVTLAEAKSALRLTDTSQDAMVRSYITACTYTAETYIGRDLIPSTYVQYLDYWPQGDIHMLRPPLQSVTSIKYLDESGVQQTLASNQYVVDTKSLPGRISRAYGVSWPSLRGQNAQIEVTYVAGHQEKTGQAAGEITAGAQTSILADNFDIAPGRSGILYLENSNGEYETIAYTAAQEFSGTYTFIVNGTLVYTYPDDSIVIAHNIPDVWRQGIIALVVDMFEHPEASSEILLYQNKTVQRLLKMNSIQEF